MNKQTSETDLEAQAHFKGLGEVMAYLTELVARHEVDVRFAHKLAVEVRTEIGMMSGKADAGRAALYQALDRFDAEINKTRANGFVRAAARLREADGA